jgi:hypothetical protein
MRGGRARAAGLGAAGLASYVTLLAGEVALCQKAPKSVLKLMERGLYVVDERGATLRPGARLHFDDGYARGDVVISSLGYRGHEPRADSIDRVLLLGDSFAFGSLLDQPDTIDACMERLESDREVINLGVTGYNLPEPMGSLRRWALGARHVVYLYSFTDLDGCVDQLIVDGYRMRRLQHPDGTPFTDDEMGSVTSQRIAQIKRSRRLTTGSLLLPRVRSALHRLVAARTSDRRSDSFADVQQREAAVAHGVICTEEMRAFAEGRGMTFHVVIVPTVMEVRRGSYVRSTNDFVAALKDRGYAPIELLGDLSRDDYWRHDTHLNPAGARLAASAIDAALNLGT